MPVTHAFVSTVTDDPAHPEEVRPSNWNDGHVTNIDLATEVSGILPEANGGTGSSTAPYIKKDGTTTATALIPFAQGVSVTGGAINVQLPNANVYNLTRTIPTTVSDEVDVGSFALTNGAGNFEIWINVPSSGYAQSKRYFIPAYYHGTAGAWQKVCAASNTGPYNNSGTLQDVDLEINSNNATTSFRLRRSSGTTAATAQIMIIHEGTITDAFTPSTSTTSVAAVTVTYRVFADQLQILSTPGDLGSYSLASWNGTSVPVPAFLKSPSVSGTSGGAGISATEPALVLGRSGIASTTFPNFAEFKIGRYVNVGAEARTRLDIALTHGNGDAAGTNALSLYSDTSIVGYGSITTPNFVSSVATGTQPYATTSTTVNTNLNAQRWNGLTNSVTSLTSGNIFYYDGTNVVNLANPTKGSFQLNSSGGITSWGLVPTPSTPTWSAVLTVGRTSGGVNPQLTTSDRLEFRGTGNYLTSSSTNDITVITGDTFTLTPATKTITSKPIESTVSTGISPFTIASTTKVTNLNADLVDGISVGTMTANKMLYTDASSVLSAAMATYNTALASITPVMNFAPSSSSIKGFALTGTSSDGTSDTEGITFSLSHNGSGNRQMQIVNTDAAASDPSFRIYFVSGSMGIDCVSADASTRKDLIIGTNTTSVFFGDTTASVDGIGKITAQRLTLTPAGSGIFIKEGTNACMGVATLVGGTVVVSTTKVTANSRIFLTAQSLGTITVGQGLAVSARTAGTSFTILSQSALDTSVVAWEIKEPA